MPDDPAAARPAPASLGGRRGRFDLGAFRATVRSVRSAMRLAFANDGIRRLAIAWMLGIAADGALLVVTLVTVFNRGGFVAAGILTAVRMVPAVIAGMFAGSLIERFGGDRILVASGLIRAFASAMIAYAIATAGSTMADRQVLLVQLFVWSSVAAVAAAPVRPAQITLIPALARGPEELVAANTVWATGEGIGAFVGPFVASLLMALNFHPVVALLAAVAFVVTAVIALGLRFEQSADKTGGGQAHGEGGRFRFLDGLRAVRAKPLLHWTIFGTFWQVVTRGLLNAMTVVASIELLGMGQWGTGMLGAALGLGGLFGAIFAMTSVRSDRLVRTEIVALVFWGLPLSVIGLISWTPVALVAMVVIGVANATYDVALFTILQRANSNEDRAPVLSVLEVVIGLGAVAGGLLAPALLFVFGNQGGLIVGGLILPAMAGLMYLRIGRIERVSLVDEQLVALLRRVPAFAELPMTAVERMAAGLVPFAAAAGTALMTQGEPGDRFLVIGTGEIEVFVDGRPIHRDGPGAGVGEIALLRRSPRTATVMAVTDVTGYGVDAATFLAAVAGPAAAAVTERMVQTNLARSSAGAPGGPGGPSPTPAVEASS
jgi:MFS family permease